MKAILLLFITFSAYSAVLQQYDHLLEGLGGGGGGGGAVDSVFGRSGNVIAVSGDYNASLITNIPYTQIDGTGNVASTSVQGAINELAEEKADISGDLVAGSKALELINDIVYRDPVTGFNTTLEAGTTLTSSYVLRLPPDGGVAGQVLTTQGGNPAVTSWTTVKSITDADGDTSVHTETAADEDKIRFTTATAERMIVDETGKVGINTSTPAGIFDVSSTTSGALIPRMTEEQRDLITVDATTDGMVVFVTTANGGADNVDRFSWYDHDALAWKYLVSKAYVDGADAGAGALTVYSTSLAGGDVILDQTTVFNFVDRSQGGVSINTQLTIPAGTTVVPAGVVGISTTKYVSLKHTPGVGNVTADISYVLYNSPNNINLGKEILITGPFTDGTGTITGTVQFQQYATNHAGIYTSYLDGAQRARFIGGGAISLSDPDAGTTNLLEFSVGTGTTYNSLMRDVEEESAWTAKDSTTADSYRYKANTDVFDFIAPPNAAITPNEYWNGTAVTICPNNNFTVHAILAFPGSASNQFIGTHLGNECYATLIDAENEIFSGKALEGRSEGSLSAILVGYIIVKTNIPNDFSTSTEGADWKVIGPQDVVSLTIAAGSAANLGDLSDVDVATTPLIPGHVISYNGVSWVNNEYPRNMDTVTRDAMVSPAKGMLIFNTDTQAIEYKDQDGWVRLPSDYLSDGFVSYFKAPVIVGASTVSMATDGDHFQTAECNPSLIGRTVDFGRWNGVSWTSSSSTITAVNAATIGQCDLTVDPVTTLAGDTAFLATDTTLNSVVAIGATTIDIVYGTGFTATECTAGASMSAIFVHSATASERVAVTSPGADNTTFCRYTLDGTTMANAFAAGTKAWPTVIGTQDYLITIPVAVEADAIQIADADGDTKITVEEVADEDTIRMDIGNAGTSIEKFWMNRLLAELKTEGGLLIDPKEDDGTPAIGGSLPLDVIRYKGSSTGAVQDVGQFRANVDVGVTPAAGDGGSINLSGHGNTTTSINLAEIDWYSTLASDSISTVGRLQFNVNSDQASDPRAAVQINPANLTVVGLLNGLETAGDTPASITLNDADNTNSIAIQVPADVTATQQITLPATSPTGPGEVLSVASTGAGLTTLQWASASGGPTFTTSNSSIIRTPSGPYLDIMYNGTYVFMGGNPANQSGTVEYTLPYNYDRNLNVDIVGPLKLIQTVGAERSIGAGDSYSPNNGPDPASILNLEGAFTKFVNTGFFQAGLAADGTLYTMGYNNTGTIGNCGNTSLQSPYAVGTSASCDTTSTTAQGVPIPDTWSDFAVTYTGNYGTGYNTSICAVSATDSSLWCWGWNGNGVLGQGNNTNYNYPRLVTNYRSDDGATTAIDWNTTNVVQIKGGAFNTDNNVFGDTNMGIRLNFNGTETLLISGKNAWGEIGDGTTTARNLFTVSSPNLGVFALSTLTASNQNVVDFWRWGSGPGGHCAIREDNNSNTRQVFCFGYGVSGEIGNGASLTVGTPTLAQVTIDAANWDYVIDGAGVVGNYVRSFNCARVAETSAQSDIRVVCWGNNGVGQLADGTITNRNVPTEINLAGQALQARKLFLPTLKNNTDDGVIACGLFENDATGQYSTYCWGDNSTGVITGIPDAQMNTGAWFSLGTTTITSPHMQYGLAGNQIHDLYCKNNGTNTINLCMAMDTAGQLYCSGRVSQGVCGMDVGAGDRRWFKTTGKSLILE